MSAPVPSFTFSKDQRLSSKKYIGELFSNGSFFHLGPILFKYLEKEGLDKSQVLFSVPKKRHKKAHIRNLIRRRMKEAYRLNQHQMPNDRQFFLAIIYLSPEVLLYKDIEQKLIKGIKRLHSSNETGKKGMT